MVKKKKKRFCFVLQGLGQNLLKRETLGIFVESAASQRNHVQDRSVVSGLKCLQGEAKGESRF